MFHWNELVSLIDEKKGITDSLLNDEKITQTLNNEALIIKSHSFFVLTAKGAARKISIKPTNKKTVIGFVIKQY